MVGVASNYLGLSVEKIKDSRVGLFLQSPLILADLLCPVQNSLRICASRDKMCLLQHFNTGFCCLFTQERKTCTSFYACAANHQGEGISRKKSMALNSSTPSFEERHALPCIPTRCSLVLHQVLPLLCGGAIQPNAGVLYACLLLIQECSVLEFSTNVVMLSHN